MKTAILFDLDGTLLDTLQDLAAAVNHVLHSFGYPERTIDEVRRFVGNGARRLMELAVPASADVDAALAAFRVYYDAHCRVCTKPYEDIPEALDILKEKYPVAIVSNKPDAAVKQLCADLFPGVYALGEAADCPRKPAPDMVFKAMAALGVEKCIYVGDSEVDVQTAKNAGVPGISVLWGFRDKKKLEEAGADCFCESPSEIIAKIEELIRGQ